MNRMCIVAGARAVAGGFGGGPGVALIIERF